MEFIKSVTLMDVAAYFAMTLIAVNFVAVALFTEAKYLKTFVAIMLLSSTPIIYAIPTTGLSYIGIGMVSLMTLIFLWAYIEDDHKFGRFSFVTSGLCALFSLVIPGVICGHLASYILEKASEVINPARNS